MQMKPRYGDDPIITLDGPPSAIAAATIRQRRRLTDRLGSFTDAEWAHPSRCEGWSNRDVIVHLDSTNFFWTASIAAGLQGTPTRFLATFDPVTAPAQLVAQSELPAAAAFERFRSSTQSLLELLASLGDNDWTTLAEAPPGHLGVSALAHHALWDAWVHERDILLPLGEQPDERPDEIIAGLRYVAALAPALAMNEGATERGRMSVSTTRPDASFIVVIGDRVAVRDGGGEADLELRGDAVELLEALSIRTPLAQPVPPAVAWMVRGLSVAFDG